MKRSTESIFTKLFCGMGLILFLAGTATAAITGAITGIGSVSAQTFIEGSEDVPLAPSLIAVQGAGMVFDSPSGRIVEAFANVTGPREDVLRFYAETLPKLGWVAESETHFRREEERLSIDFFGQDGALSVRFTLSPQ